MKTCPKCGADITDSYNEAEPDVGIMETSWYCDKCDVLVVMEDDDYDDT